METNIICRMQNVSIIDKETTITDLNLEIEAGSIVALATKDTVSSAVLQVMAGFRGYGQGEVDYPLLDMDKPSAQWLQYVPDDIICYQGLKIREYFHGVALATPFKIREELERLCEVFELDVEEELLELTFEQNRLVTMIQALVYKPKFLLLDRPNDMLGRKAYLQLWEEIRSLQKQGTTVVFTIDTYKDSIVPCHRYLFFRDGDLEYDLRREDLPLPAKVITLEGGSLDAMDMEKGELLCKDEATTRLLYWEDDMKELALAIADTGCENFHVEELSLEEEIFEDYERWML